MIDIEALAKLYAAAQFDAETSKHEMGLLAVYDKGWEAGYERAMEHWKHKEKE